MDIAGHVSKQMLRHYSHIRMEAKRQALESIVNRRSEHSAEAESVPSEKAQTVGYPQLGGRVVEASKNRVVSEANCSQLTTESQHFDAGYPQKSLQS
jgi:BRCT domain type II-containing protein